jgi:hypothetical protein
MQQTTSTLPHRVPQPESSHNTTSLASQEASEREQLLKFFIGLRLLGEKRQQRFLAYMATLLKEAPSGKESE